MDLGLEAIALLSPERAKASALPWLDDSLLRGLSWSVDRVSLQQSWSPCSQGGDVVHVVVDLTAEMGPSQLVEAALSRGPIDLLINNAGAVTPRLGGFISVTDEQWSATMALTFMAAVRTTRAVLPHMIDRGSGSIVNNASVNATLRTLVIDYSAAKAALANFSKALSKEVGPHGIRVNAVSAGPVSTELWLGTEGWPPPSQPLKAPTRMTSLMKLSRTQPPVDLPHQRRSLDLIVVLASNRASNVTGGTTSLTGV